MPEETPTRAHPLADRITLWTGIVGTALTVVLTAWNAYTKTQIDQREASLRDLELKLKERSAGLEESRERVDRYKWVLGLFPDLTNSNAQKRNFTVSLIRLALTQDEASQLFTGLQTSTDTALSALGTTAIASIEIEPIARLVAQMNADDAGTRKRAVAELERRYASSSQAITLALQALGAGRLETLSPSAVINALYFLGHTDPAAWDRAQLAAGRAVADRVAARSPGAQTNTALTAFRTLLQQVRSQ